MATALDIFGPGNVHEGPCCDCCNGYCPDFGAKPTARVHPVTINGFEYYTDRYVAIREDRVDVSGAEIEARAGEVIWPEAPADKPGPSTAVLSADTAGRLLDLGWDICEGEPYGRQHIYDGDEHIGWITSCGSRVEGSPLGGMSMRLDDLQALRAIIRDGWCASDSTTDLGNAAIALNIGRAVAAIEAGEA